MPAESAIPLLRMQERRLLFLLAFGGLLSLIALTIYTANLQNHPFVFLLDSANPGWVPVATFIAAIVIPLLGKLAQIEPVSSG